MDASCKLAIGLQYGVVVLHWVSTVPHVAACTAKEVIDSGKTMECVSLPVVPERESSAIKLPVANTRFRLRT
jgi:hypothetical protein